MDEAKKRRGVVNSMESDNILIDQIMLRFRPIIPKPVTADSSGGASPMIRKRVKRKYVRVKKKTKGEKNTDTDLLLDEKSASWRRLDLDSVDGENITDPLERKVSNWISFGVPAGSKTILNMNKFIYDHDLVSAEKQLSDLHGVDLTMSMEIRQPKVIESSVVESWITMENVTGACEDQRLLGYTDDEIWKNLETDTCPGFISNGYEEVVWVNQAYRKMLDLNNNQAEMTAKEVAVYLVVKVEKSVVDKYFPALSCRVRIEYRKLSEKKMPQMMVMVVPCDVCKMDSGDFAWRLDIKAALSLGPLI